MPSGSNLFLGLFCLLCIQLMQAQHIENNNDKIDEPLLHHTIEIALGNGVIDRNYYLAEPLVRYRYHFDQKWSVGASFFMQVPWYYQYHGELFFVWQNPYVRIKAGAGGYYKKAYKEYDEGPYVLGTPVLPLFFLQAGKLDLVYGGIAFNQCEMFDSLYRAWVGFVPVKNLAIDLGLFGNMSYSGFLPYVYVSAEYRINRYWTVAGAFHLSAILPLIEQYTAVIKAGVDF